jgi:hypothetical protein
MSGARWPPDAVTVSTASRVVAVAGLGAVPPERDVLLADVERAGVVVGDAALALGAQGERPHRGGRQQPVVVGVGELELAHGAGPGDLEAVHLLRGRTLVHAEALTGGADGGPALGRGDELAGVGVHVEEPDGAVHRADEIVGGAVDRDVLPHVDVAPEGVVEVDPLHQRAVEVVAVERAALVVHDDQ